MPRFMDIHKRVDGLTADAVADAHQKDIDVQDKHDVKQFLGASHCEVRGDMTHVTSSSITIPPGSGNSFDFGGLGVQWKIDGTATGQRLSVVHHPMAPRALAAPLHSHHNEDELSYVLTGTLGALLGDDVLTAGPGTWVFKPRRQWHTFWNAGDTPCEIIEIISPAGFENYFREVAAAWGDIATFETINRKYSLEMRFDSVPDLCARFGLTFPAL